MKKILISLSLIIQAIFVFGQNPEQPKSAAAQDLALKLANPVAAMISVPFQFNTMLGVGPSISIPTAPKPYFGYEKWAIGPSAVVIKQTASGWS